MALTWFVLHCAYRAEFRAIEAIRELGNDLGCAWDVYCPVERRIVTHARRRTPKDFPLLAPYIFVGLEGRPRGERTEYPFRRIRDIEHVEGFLGAAGAPLQVIYDAPDPEFARADRGPQALTIAQIRAMEAAGDFDRTLNVLAVAAIQKAQASFKCFIDMGVALGRRGQDDAGENPNVVYTNSLRPRAA